MSEEVENERRSQLPAADFGSAGPRLSLALHVVIGQPITLVVYADRAVLARVPIAPRQAERLAWELLGAAIGRPAQDAPAQAGRLTQGGPT